MNNKLNKKYIARRRYCTKYRLDGMLFKRDKRQTMMTNSKDERKLYR